MLKQKSTYKYKTATMPNYANGKIYTIRSYQTDKFYIGSTTQKLSKRLVGHRTTYKRWKNGKNEYRISSFDMLQCDDYYIELLEEFPCTNKMELNRREGFHIRENKATCVNCNIAGRTDKEYYEDNKEKLAKQNYKYRQNNKETISEREAQYRNDNKEKISKRGAQYYKDNKEKLAKCRFQRYQNDKEKLKQKITCGCGSVMRIDGKVRHHKSKKHINWVANNENIEVSTNDFNNLHAYI